MRAHKIDCFVRWQNGGEGGGGKEGGFSSSASPSPQRTDEEGESGKDTPFPSPFSKRRPHQRTIEKEEEEEEGAFPALVFPTRPPLLLLLDVFGKFTFQNRAGPSPP